jgi:hypothetical protein
VITATREVITATRDGITASVDRFGGARDVITANFA